MSEKCSPNYKNLNTIQSYSEQKYATVQWCEQNCENDEWLRQEVEKLKYLSPPSVRKWLKISDCTDLENDRMSWGCTVNGDGNVVFDNRLKKEIIVDLADPKYINYIDTNTSKTTAYAEAVTVTLDDSEVDEDDPDVNKNESVIHRYGLHSKDMSPTSSSENTVTFGTANDRKGFNSAWYIGYDKTKKYYVRPDWIKNWKDSDIKSVCRAQTFTVPEGKGGNLMSVDLKLQFNGSDSGDCGSPLYVQIWKTYPKYVYYTEWDSTTKQSKYKYVTYESRTNKKAYANKTRYEEKTKEVIVDKKKNTKKTVKYYVKNKNGAFVRKLKTVRWLGRNKYNDVDKRWTSDIYHPLAEAEFDHVENGLVTVKFDKPCEIKEGGHYAIVLFSPLSEWKKCPRWCGWGRNCKNDSVYAGGNAFLSENNGRTWIMYGKNDTTLKEYKKGKYTPQDFSFRCTVEKKTNKYTDEEQFVYLKPIYANRITQVKIAPNDIGSEPTYRDKFYVIYEISTDGEEWYEIDNTHPVTLDKPSNVILCRARMKTYVTGDGNTDGESPYIYSITLTLYTLPATEMYCRTKAFTPRTDAMLGANLWGRVYAPFDDSSPTVNCSAEIICGKTSKTTFKILELDDVVEEIKDINEEIDVDVATLSVMGDEELAEHLSNNFEIIQSLKDKNMYIKPHISDNKLKLYLLSFANDKDVVLNADDNGVFPSYTLGGLSFSEQVANPVLNVINELPSDTDGVTSFSEWIDFNFDYGENKLFFKPNRIDNVMAGALTVEYNPVFIDNLSNTEVGVHIDEDTGLRSEGLIMDYFKEKILIEDSHLINRSVQLRVKPVDPIKQVYLYKYDSDEGDEPIELYEGIDFTVDVDTNKLIFEVNNTDGVSTMLSLGDVVQIVYTPALEDPTIYMGYHATRTNTDMQCYIKDLYYEYKV